MRRLADMIRAIALMAALLATVPASAHFQEILPSDDVLPDGGKVTLDLVFTHPMEGGPVMEMKRPKRVGALVNGRTIDLSASLKALKKQGVGSWALTHELKEPGAAIYFVEPEPYWDQSEGKFIVHYAKVVVDGFASGRGWDASIGLPVEMMFALTLMSRVALRVRVADAMGDALIAEPTVMLPLSVPAPVVSTTTLPPSSKAVTMDAAATAEVAFVEPVKMPPANTLLRSDPPMVMS